MAPNSVDAQGPPRQAVELIAIWGETNAVWLENRGNGHAAFSMWLDGERRTVALVEYGSTAATSDVRWNRTGCMALEEYKRNAWDTQIYSKIAAWLKARS